MDRLRIAFSRKLSLILTSLTLILGGGVAALAAPVSAQAESGASGIVAIHTGSWGYREVVYGKSSTQQLYNETHPMSNLWGAASYLGGLGASAAINPFSAAAAGTYMWTVQQQVGNAVAHNTCFALVRLAWVPVYWPGVEPWGCR
jgi:hypothetical protein